MIGSHQKSLRVLHSPSDQGHFTFHWNFFSSHSISHFLKERALFLSAAQSPAPKNHLRGKKKKGGGNNVAGSKKTAANTPNGKVSREERKMATPHIACLGTQSLAPSQHFKPFGFTQGLRKKTFFFFFFLSVQTRTMNSSSPQKCDKVSTTPTRKVIYGWPDGLELP